MGHNGTRWQTLEPLGADIAHEVNNFLTVAAGWVEMAKEDGAAPEKYLSRALEAIQDARGMLTELMDVGMPGTEGIQTADLADLLRRIQRLAGQVLRKDHIALTVDIRAHYAVVRGRPLELLGLLLDLLMNARQAMPDGGKLVFCLRRRNGTAELDVTDSGCGMSKEEQRKVFQPLFTTRAAKGGKGRGLTICQKTVEQYGGTIDLESEPHRGTRITVRMPLAHPKGEPDG